MSMLTLSPVTCTECHTTQYFGVNQQYGTLNRHYTRYRAYRRAINMLWHTTSQMVSGLCPTCVQRLKVRRIPKITVNTDIKDIEYNRYRYGNYHPIKSLLWRKKVYVNSLYLWEGSSLDLGCGRSTYTVSRSDLIDPMIFDLFTHRHARPDYPAWIRAILQDQLDYCTRMSEQPVERGVSIQVIQEPDEEA